MESWQKILLYAVLAFSILHLVRDILQDYGDENLLATIWNKPQPASNIYSYVIESIVVILAAVSLAGNNFGYTGYGATVLLAGSMTAWLIYYFI